MSNQCENGMCGHCASCASDSGDALTIEALRRDLELADALIDRLRVEVSSGTAAQRALEVQLREARHSSEVLEAKQAMLLKTIDSDYKTLDVVGDTAATLQHQVDSQKSTIEALERRLLESETCSRCHASNNEIRSGRIVEVRPYCVCCAPKESK